MKKLLSAAAVAATLALVASPGIANDLVRENRSVDAKVTKVKLDGIVDLVVRQGNTPSLVVSGDRRFVQRITTSQRGDTLEIGTESFNTRRNEMSEKLRAELTVPNLAEFTSQGVGASTVTGFSGNSIQLALDGAGSVTMNSNYRNIDARLGGVGGLANHFCRLAFTRSAPVKYCLRMRTLFGVISRYSSSAIISSPRSMVSSRGGTNTIASSELFERTFVKFFPLVGFTVISSPFDVLPITIPAYTAVPGPM